MNKNGTLSQEWRKLRPTFELTPQVVGIHTVHRTRAALRPPAVARSTATTSSRPHALDLDLAAASRLTHEPAPAHPPIDPLRAGRITHRTPERPAARQAASHATRSGRSAVDRAAS